MNWQARKHATLRALTAAGLGMTLWVTRPMAQTNPMAAQPQFTTERGSEPMPGDPATVRDDLWRHIKYPEYTGFKPRLAVVFPARKDRKAGEADWEKQLDPQSRFLNKMFDRMSEDETPKSTLVDIDIDGLERLVRQALGATGQFTMVERLETQAVLDEQDFGQGERVDKKTAARIGRIKGADYVVTAQVIETNREKESKDISVGAGMLTRRTLGIGSVGVSGKVAFCRINVTITDSETGEIYADLTVDGTANSKKVSVDAGMLGGVGSSLLGSRAKSSSKSDAAITDAVQVCVNKMAYHAVRQLAKVPWNGSITGAEVGKVMINAGQNVGLKTGLELDVYAKGAEVFDPDTGESLGHRKTRIGRVRISMIDEKFAECEVIEGCGGVKRGDLVRLDRSM